MPLSHSSTGSSSFESTTHIQVENKANETLILKPGDEEDSYYDLHLKNLIKCKVDLRHLDEGQFPWAALQISDCVGCTFLAGRIDGSVMVRNDVCGTIIVGCKQVRGVRMQRGSAAHP